jgi:hypothetical protein
VDNSSGALLAVFSNPDNVTDAVKSMIQRGNDALEILSPIPLPELEELLPRRPSTVRWFTLLGCIAGALSGFGLQILTALHWPLYVGGKPIDSISAFIVIGFELTILLGAMAAVLGFLINTKLPPITKKAYVPGCSQKDFALIVKHSPSEYAVIEAKLREAGAREVQPLEPSLTEARAVE